ncbi:glycosyltransferase [Photobacterium phosphoreum]|uniref:glycosyltransferase n=1 Tax=Photobacterium phosphoreum TaxID=659 RepID=UPI0013903E37|nr:glycosyltransferase [Photobacterium phosphoreum]
MSLQIFLGKNMLFLVNIELINFDGITNKIISQKNAFEKSFDKCDFSYISIGGNDSGRFINDELKENYTGIKLAKTFKSMICFNSLNDFIIENKVDFLYIRYSQFCNPFFLYFLSEIKKNNCTIYMEIPTYPYDKESSFNKIAIIKKALYGFFNWQEKITRKYIYRYIDRVITFSDDDYIFGIKTIKINNAVSSSLPLTISSGRNIIKLIGVARLSNWHGYDRLIKSIHKYGNKNIEFHIVGNGKCKSELVNLKNSLSLDNIYFHGEKTGKDLDDLFNGCHIGIDSLGRHRSGNNTNSSLKSKEYLMRGLPIIKSHVDLGIDDSLYYYDVPSDNSDFDINKIVKWYIDNNFNNIDIRNYALSNFTWDVQINKIKEEFINGNSGK